MSGKESRTIGMIGEQVAVDFLTQKGYTVMKRNYHSRYGEIDIIVRNLEYIVFVEVKTRNETSDYRPAEAVNKSKQKKLWRTALLYLTSEPQDLQPRMDVVEVTLSKGTKLPVHIEHLENAFYWEDSYAAY